MTNEKSDFEKRFTELGAIWKGDKALSFKLQEDIKATDSVVAFPNKFSTDENKQPDYRLYKDTESKKEA